MTEQMRESREQAQRKGTKSKCAKPQENVDEEYDPRGDVRRLHGLPLDVVSDAVCVYCNILNHYVRGTIGDTPIHRIDDVKPEGRATNRYTVPLVMMKGEPLDGSLSSGTPAAIMLWCKQPLPFLALVTRLRTARRMVNEQPANIEKPTMIRAIMRPCQLVALRWIMSLVHRGPQWYFGG